MKMKFMKGGSVAALFLCVLCIPLFFLFTGCSKDPIELDAFENMKILYSGWNSKGKATVDNEISYAGKDETVQKLIEEIDYKIKPNKGLSNGDTITVTLVYDTDLQKRANVTFKEEEKTFNVHGLNDENRKITTHKSIEKDEDGNEHEVYSQTVEIDGVEIPTAWGLSEEEMQSYVAYIKSLENSEFSEEEAITVDVWMQGESETTTNRKSADFLTKDYLDNGITTYNEAYKYGIESSQKFKIEPIMKNGKTTGYRCIFEGDED